MLDPQKSKIAFFLRLEWESAFAPPASKQCEEALQVLALACEVKSLGESAHVWRHYRESTHWVSSHREIE